MLKPSAFQERIALCERWKLVRDEFEFLDKRCPKAEFRKTLSTDGTPGWHEILNRSTDWSLTDDIKWRIWLTGSKATGTPGDLFAGSSRNTEPLEKIATRTLKRAGDLFKEYQREFLSSQVGGRGAEQSWMNYVGRRSTLEYSNRTVQVPWAFAQCRAACSIVADRILCSILDAVPAERLDTANWPERSPSELAKMMGVSPATVVKRLKNGKIPNQMVTSKAYRVDPEWLHGKD